MARYTEFKRKVFDLKKDARDWASKIKKQNAGSGMTMKIETNYLSKDGRWEGVVLQRVE